MPNPYVDHVNGDNSIIDIQDKELRERADKTTQSATGNPISISGLKSNQLAINPIITLEPIQAGSGTPSPSNVRAISGYDKIDVLSCGKNLAYDMIPQPSRQANISKNGNTYTISGYGGAFISAKVGNGKTYILSLTVVSGSYTNIRRYPTLEAGPNDSYDAIEVGTPFTATADGYIRFWVNDEVVLSNIQLEEGQTATTYEPPVKATSISESLGQTVYGGSLDVRTGKFTVTHGGVDLGDLTWDYSAQFSLMYANMPDNAPTPVYGGNLAICSMYDCYTGSYSGQTDKTFTLCNTSWFETKTVAIKDTSYSDPTAFKTAVTGQKLVYPLATPFTIQLTPHEISLLKDYVYVSTNGTNIALDYHNGEIASLADVAQVGETLNNLGDALPLKFKQVYLSASVIGTSFSPTAIQVGSIANLFGEDINQNRIAGITICQAPLNPASILHIGFFNNNVFIAATQNTVLDGGFWVNILYVEDK